MQFGTHTKIVRVAAICVPSALADSQNGVAVIIFSLSAEANGTFKPLNGNKISGRIFRPLPLLAVKKLIFAPMGRFMGIDYGTKRVGLAVSDPLKIIAGGLDTVPTAQIFDYLKNYLTTESVECFVIGDPLKLDGTDGKTKQHVVGFIRKLEKEYPDIKIELVDERFSSAEASRAILMSGTKKKKRRDKGLIDKISAVVILQEYMESLR